eukprot:TRINITY_DN19804_c0_g1_i2.p1 TRINITY_DN19804_c0_g1~~TRINITY_DN19804_c0_g1_i2.p1  ORF type:complete len:585 (-),score=159.70 TRINITY_DN19804_c0_g1_i2:488-2242(-)
MTQSAFMSPQTQKSILSEQTQLPAALASKSLNDACSQTPMSTKSANSPSAKSEKSPSGADKGTEENAKKKSLHDTAVMLQLTKTKMCAFFERGKCSSETCRYAHSESELRLAPNLQKTKLCKAFLQGNCSREDCFYAHGESDLRVTAGIYKTQMCNFFERGHCKKGDRCNHAHGSTDLRPPASKKDSTGAPPTPVPLGEAVAAARLAAATATSPTSSPGASPAKNSPKKKKETATQSTAEALAGLEKAASAASPSTPTSGGLEIFVDPSASEENSAMQNVESTPARRKTPVGALGDSSATKHARKLKLLDVLSGKAEEMKEVSCMPLIVPGRPTALTSAPGLLPVGTTTPTTATPVTATPVTEFVPGTPLWAGASPSYGSLQAAVAAAASFHSLGFAAAPLDPVDMLVSASADRSLPPPLAPPGLGLPKLMPRLPQAGLFGTQGAADWTSSLLTAQLPPPLPAPSTAQRQEEAMIYAAQAAYAAAAAQAPYAAAAAQAHYGYDYGAGSLIPELPSAATPTAFGSDHNFESVQQEQDAYEVRPLDLSQRLAAFESVVRGLEVDVADWRLPPPGSESLPRGPSHRI